MPQRPDAGSPMLCHFHRECQSLAKLHFSNGVTSVEGDLVVQSQHFKLKNIMFERFEGTWNHLDRNGDQKNVPSLEALRCRLL